MIESNFKGEFLQQNLGNASFSLGTCLTDDDLNTWHTGRDEDYHELTVYEEKQPRVKGMR